ncbi:hypothetical protein EV361DRAFT_955370 [Lentinula raphanica]|nr:hypothetical protein C8R42DRAFT_729757 [Lentinula raphanica]KAJ3965054.1 hypothetical protein EV361DRAFT_955370 [Lentinula raphanica]
MDRNPILATEVSGATVVDLCVRSLVSLTASDPSVTPLSASLFLPVRSPRHSDSLSLSDALPVIPRKESRLNIAVVDFRSLLRPFLLVLGSMGPARELDISAVTASGSMGSAHALDTSASGEQDVEHEGGQTKKYSAYANTEPNREEKHGDKTPNGIGKSEGRQKNEEANNFRWQIREHLRKYLSLSGGMQFVNTDQLRADDPWLPVEQIGAEEEYDDAVTTEAIDAYVLQQQGSRLSNRSI